MEFFAFDKDYLDRLLKGDAATEHHFVAYFEQLLRIKLRTKMLAPTTLENLRQETFVRVMAALRRHGGGRQPERFGAFVNSICNNVLMEHSQSSAKNLPMEGTLDPKQTSEQLRRILQGMSKRDGDLLRAIFLEEKDKDAVCREMGVDRDYLRVLLKRTKRAFNAKVIPSAERLPGAKKIANSNEVSTAGQASSGVEVPGAKQEEPNHNPAPPGAVMYSIAEFICSKRTMEEVVVPLLADMQFEYSEAFSAGRRLEASWVRLRGCWSFFTALGINRFVGLCARIFLRLSSQ